MSTFPNFSDSQYRDKIADLVRLRDRSLTEDTKYVDGKRASRLLGVVFKAFRDAVRRGQFEDELLQSAFEDKTLLGLTLAAAFDLVANAEYLHGRLVNSNWIYCHRDDEPPRAYFSFLKQCPRCCLDKGLENRLSGAQHKPTSHHIGEITTVVSALIIEFIATANDSPLTVATISKQSHDVDAIGFRDNLLVLFEIKASPMVTFPLVVNLPEPLRTDSPGEPEEYAQHSLVDVSPRGLEAHLAIPHTTWDIPLGEPKSHGWPYDSLIEYIRQPGNFLAYLSAWLELYHGYSVPKTQRTEHQMALSYLVNGWGDEIDSNKTKPGLGRTDDIKKGTYQLLKFGSYYRDDSSSLPVRSALVANLDPLFLRKDYLDGLSDVRWGHQQDFSLVDGEYRIASDSLKYLYDAIVAFNEPLLNDDLLSSVFDFESVANALVNGRLDRLLDVWSSSGPEAAVEESAQGRLL